MPIQRGLTFGATEEVTNTKLHNIVDNATISNLAQAEMAGNTGVVLRQTTTPSDTDALWVDTSITPNIIRHHDGTEYVPSGPYAILTNKSGGQVVAGDVVIIDTANAGSFTTTTSANNIRVIGVVMETIADNADGVIALPGARVTSLNVDATTAVGDFLATATTATQATPTSTIPSACFAIALASRTGAGLIAEALIINYPAAAATQAEMESASLNTVFASPGRVQNHPGVVKAWINFDGTGTPAVTASYNMDSSITDHAIGQWTVTMTTDFSDTNYCPVGMLEVAAGTNLGNLMVEAGGAALGTLRLRATTLNNIDTDYPSIYVAMLGDQ